MIDDQPVRPPRRRTWIPWALGAACLLLAAVIAAKIGWSHVTLRESVESPDGRYRAQISAPWEFMETVVEVKVVRIDGLLNRDLGSVCTQSIDSEIHLRWADHTLQIVYPSGRVLGSATLEADEISWDVDDDRFRTC